MSSVPKTKNDEGFELIPSTCNEEEEEEEKEEIYPNTLSKWFGLYENLNYSTYEQNEYHFVKISPVSSSGSILDQYLLWETLTNAWKLKVTFSDDSSLHCEVGEECPYFTDGYRNMSFAHGTPGSDSSMYAIGPGEEKLTKVDHFSDIACTLMPKSGANSLSKVQGEYICERYKEKNGYHFVKVFASGNEEEEKELLVWKNKCCAWELNATERDFRFTVGEQCPYSNTYREMHFNYDAEQDKVLGCYGPHMEYYTRVADLDEKEVLLLQEEQRGVKGKTNEFEVRQSNFLKRVTIGENFKVEFDVTVHSANHNSWASLLHVGHSDEERSPGIWLHKNSCRVFVRLSDVVSKDSDISPNFELEIGKKHHIVVECVDKNVKVAVDGELLFLKKNVVHVTRFETPVWGGDPWYMPADATISNLLIN